jgi:Tol biopolymer transport system component
MSGRRSVFVTDFDQVAHKIRPPQPLTEQTALEYPTAWSSDSTQIVFASNRNGPWQLWKQRYGTDKPELLVSSLTDVADQTPLMPDGKSLLNVSADSSGRRRVSAIPIDGGAPNLLIVGPILSVRCSRSQAGQCILLEESPDHKQFVFSKLDSAGSRGGKLAQIDRDDSTAGYEWALSPDGRMIALARQFDGTIRLIPVDSNVPRVIRVEGWPHLRNITFTADGKGFFASHPSKHGAELLYVNLDGTVKVLWELPGYNVYLRALPSPDGRHLAILGSMVENNVWTMEDF